METRFIGMMVAICGGAWWMMPSGKIDMIWLLPIRILYIRRQKGELENYSSQCWQGSEEKFGSGRQAPSGPSSLQPTSCASVLEHQSPVISSGGWKSDFSNGMTDSLMPLWTTALRNPGPMRVEAGRKLRQRKRHGIKIPQL